MSKIAIVTGASRGIGRGIALKLAQEGYDIAFSFFSAAQNAEELCHEIQSTTAQHCAMYCVDMREEEPEQNSLIRFPKSWELLPFW